MNNKTSTFYKYLLFFFLGGAVYYSIELVFRGYSHWTMFVLGGFCYILLGLINVILPWETYIEIQGIIGSIIITGLEFLFGYILNIKLGLGIWDYTNMPFNIMGQVCLLYSILWCALSIPGIIFDDSIRWQYFGEKKPEYRSWLVEIISASKTKLSK